MLWKGFQKPKRLAVDTSTLTDKYGIFWAQPFERGFGTTIGNALRRGKKILKTLVKQDDENDESGYNESKN